MGVVSIFSTPGPLNDVWPTFRAFADHSVSTCRPLRLREVRRLRAPSSFTVNAGLRQGVSDSALPTFPTIRFPWGTISELNYGSLALRPVELFAPLADPTKHLCSAN